MSDACRGRPSLPPVIGHRGAAALAPENTLAGFRAADGAGARWVEFDIRLSRDRACVVIHDGTLRRTAGRRTPVSRVRLADLQTCDVGSGFSPAFAGETIPSLDQALSLLCALGMGANIELKSCGRRNPGLVAAMLDTLTRLSGGAAPPVLVSSFSPALLRAVRRADARIPLGLLLARRPRRDWRRLARTLSCASVHCADQGLSPNLVARIRQEGFACVVYTVNDPARGRELLSWGVQSLITDVPDVLCAALDRDVRRRNPAT